MSRFFFCSCGALAVACFAALASNAQAPKRSFNQQAPKRAGELRLEAHESVSDLYRYRTGANHDPNEDDTTQVLTCVYQEGEGIPKDANVVHYWVHQAPVWLKNTSNRQLLNALVAGTAIHCPSKLPGVDKFSRGNSEALPTATTNMSGAKPAAQTQRQTTTSSPSRQEIEQALMAEPEMQRVHGIRQDNIDRQNLPANSVYKPTPLQGGVQFLQNIQVAKQLYWQLESRLQEEVNSCNFCALKQGELSMLLQTELGEKGVGQALSEAVGPEDSNDPSSKVLAHMFGADTEDEAVDPFADDGERYGFVGTEFAEKCKAEDFKEVADARQNCIDRGWHFYRQMAAVHRRVFSACFQNHNWAKDASERKPFEQCLKSDPLVSACRNTPSKTQCEPRISSKSIQSVFQYAASPPKQPPFVNLIFKAGTRLKVVLNRPMGDWVGKEEAKGEIWFGVVTPIQTFKEDDHSPYTVPAGIVGRIFYLVHRNGLLEITRMRLMVDRHGELEFKSVHTDPMFHDQPGAVFVPKEGQLTLILDSDRVAFDVDPTSPSHVQ